MRVTVPAVIKGGREHCADTLWQWSGSGLVRKSDTRKTQPGPVTSSLRLVTPQKRGKDVHRRQNQLQSKCLIGADIAAFTPVDQHWRTTLNATARLPFRLLVRLFSLEGE